MKKVIFMFVILISLLTSTSGFSFENVLNSVLCTIQNQYTEWFEYVEIEGQWYKITHFDDGSIIIQACGKPTND